MKLTPELHVGGSSSLSGVHRSQAHMCLRSVSIHGAARLRNVEYCSKSCPTIKQSCCERATANHNEKLRQQAAAIAASLLLSAGYTCAPAEAYNVRLQDVESKAMQAGMQATDPV